MASSAEPAQQEDMAPAGVLGGAGSDLLARLRAVDLDARVGPLERGADAETLGEWAGSGVSFTSTFAPLEGQFYRGLRELISCIKPAAGGGPILHEGGIYHGCWLESTGTINAELLLRFLPSIAERTFLAFAEHQRSDGLFPYKITADGAVFSQIQTVTPLARSVWTHHRLNGGTGDFLARMHAAMARNDEWLATWRDIRGTGGVEAFCCYDTGHDLSPRFWHVPDSPRNNDPKACPDNPVLPFVAPDLTANVACQRRYLALMAEELGQGGEEWLARAAQSEKALFEACYDAEDGFFYDLDRHGRHVRVQSDVLLRVLACEIGDDEYFAQALERYLLNTRKFFARYPFTSIALDDPRHDPAFNYNSWAGPTNFLSLIRSPHAFEAHHRHVELTWVLYPTLIALSKFSRFAQTLHPFTGREGFTEAYSPTILCLFDFIERLCGIMPRPDGTLWFTGLVPRQIEHRDASHETAYSRKVDGHGFELVNSGGESVVFRDGAELFRCPQGVRVVTDRRGAPQGIIGMSVNQVEGVLKTADGDYPFRVEANEQLGLVEGRLAGTRKPGLVPPSY